MVDLNVAQVIFENRRDAGVRLAAELGEYINQQVIVLAIPNGGVPVAVEVAVALKADLALVVSRKIPAPLSPEGGVGAVADDGTTILNEEAIKRMGLNRQQVEYEAGKVRAAIKQRSILYKGERPLPRVSGKVAIVIDDGLASGYTMMAAVESVRHRKPSEVVVAVPVAPATAVKQLGKVADRVVTCATGYMPRFYISDFYRYWHDVGDNEVIRYLNQWRTQHLR